MFRPVPKLVRSGLGIFVPGSPFELSECGARKTGLVGFAGVPLRLAKSFVAEHRHDLMGGASRLCQASARSFP
jgi:hypothetical protein